MARYLYWGVDVWLNNPLRPLEACGTSGMKAALNGALNLSIRDGWWDEWFDGENGWAIPSADGVADPDRRDDLEASALYDLIENSVAPRASTTATGEEGVPTRWVQMVRHTLKTLGPKVLATRMVGEYVRRLYAPAAASSRRMIADDFAAARALAKWRRSVVRRLAGGARCCTSSGQLAGRRDAQLGGVARRCGPRSRSAACRPTTSRSRPSTARSTPTTGSPTSRSARCGSSSTATGCVRYEGEIPLERTGGFGYTVRVLPNNDLLASPAELGVVATA